MKVDILAEAFESSKTNFSINIIISFKPTLYKNKKNKNNF